MTQRAPMVSAPPLTTHHLAWDAGELRSYSTMMSTAAIATAAAGWL